MKLKRIFHLFLMFAVVFSLASCGFLNNLTGNKNEATEYPVEFNSDGGTAVESQTVADGGLVTKPADPTKDGFTFLGWFLGDNEYNFDTPVTDNLVLVAHWSQSAPACTHVDKNDDGMCDLCSADFDDGKERYTISYKDGNTTLRLIPNTYSADSKDLQLPAAPEKAHYDFVGWYTDADFTNKAESIDVTAGCNLVFYAKYNAVSYKINYVLDGGVNAEANPDTYTMDDLSLELAAPSKDGYNFLGWYLDANCTEQVTSLSKDLIGDISVYAKWEVKPTEFKVTYLDNEGNELGTDVYYESNSDQPLRAGLELDGYVFLGWIDADTMTTYSCIPAGMTENLVLTANMKSNVSVRTLTYYINGELYSSVYFVVDDGVAELLAPSKAGYEFDGWYDNAECEGDKINAILPGAESDIALYANQTVITYTVKYFDGETELELAPSEYQISDADITLPAVPEKFGYTIKGWYDADGNKYTSIAANTIGDLTLYASYEPKVYYITYYLNGGENNENNVSEYTYGDLPTLYDPMSRDGYIFKGWYTNANGSGYAIDDLSDCANCNVTLYAMWEPTAESGGSNLTPEAPF